MNPGFHRDENFGREALNTVLAVLAICTLYVGTLYLVLHRHQSAAWCFLVTASISAVLFFTWYKHLPPPDPRSDQEIE